jgi:type IV pilus assembly protein PilE
MFNKNAFRHAAGGFTLIELMIVVAIIALLAGLALPSYRASIVKSRRVDAQKELVTYVQALERFNSTNGRYTTTAGGNTCGATAPQNSSQYTYAAYTDNTAATAGCADNTFYVVATPVAGSSQSSDGNQTLDSTGAKTGQWPN